MTDNDVKKESTSLIEEIEEQLEKVLAKKRKQVEAELEEKIRKDRDEAKRKLVSIETELKSEKKDIENYRNAIAEYENNKTKIRTEIQDHLDKAFHYQTSIEKLAGATIEELSKVKKLNEKLGELRHEATEKAGRLQNKLERKRRERKSKLKKRAD